MPASAFSEQRVSRNPAPKCTRVPIGLALLTSLFLAGPVRAQVELPQTNLQAGLLQVSPVGSLLVTTKELVRTPVEEMQDVLIPVTEIQTVDGREQEVTKYVPKPRPISVTKDVLQARIREILPSECALQWVTGKPVRPGALGALRVAQHPVVLIKVPVVDPNIELDPFYRRILNPDTLVIMVPDSGDSSSGTSDGRPVALDDALASLPELPRVMQLSRVVPELEIANPNASECRIFRIQGRGRPLLYHRLATGQSMVLRAPVGTRWRAEFGSATKPLDFVMPPVPRISWVLDSDSALEVDLEHIRAFALQSLENSDPKQRTAIEAVLAQISGETGVVTASSTTVDQGGDSRIMQVGANGEVDVRVVNQSGGALTVFYDVGESSGHEEYFSLEIDGKQQIASFVGHRWLAKVDDKTVAEFIVPEQGAATWTIGPPVRFTSWNAAEQGLFKEGSGKTWMHFGPDGQLVGRFKEMERTDEFVALFERNAQIWIRLYEDRAIIDTPATDGWQDLAQRVVSEPVAE